MVAVLLLLPPDATKESIAESFALAGFKPLDDGKEGRRDHLTPI
jgi:hypothetical protein